MICVFEVLGVIFVSFRWNEIYDKERESRAVAECSERPRELGVKEGGKTS